MPALLAVALLAFLAGTASAAVLYVETFTGLNGWNDRDAGEMDVASDGITGNPAGSLSGFFDTQDTPTPESDAWQADSGSSGGNLTGDYYTTYPTYSYWSFSFYADDVLPSDLVVRFGDGTNTFTRTVGAQVSSVDQWFTVVVPLSYAGWFGGGATAFADALTSVSFIDVQVTRNGAGSQTYYLDNFAVNSSDISTIPEPATGLFALGAVLLYLLRRTTNRALPAAA